MPSNPTVRYTYAKLLPCESPLEAQEDAVILPPNTAANPSYPRGTVLGEVTSSGAANAQQTITVTGTPTGGGFYPVFGGVTGPLIPHNSTASAVQAILQGMAPIGSGNVVCSGGALPGAAVVVTFQGQCGNLEQPTIGVIAAFAGGTSPAVAVTVNALGSPGTGMMRPYLAGASDGSQVAKRLLSYETVVDSWGRHRCVGGDHRSTESSVPAAHAGTYLTSQLVGLDAAAVAQLGRLISGSTATLSAANTKLRMG